MLPEFLFLCYIAQLIIFEQCIIRVPRYMYRSVYLYATPFLLQESWDYIGSSRMVYDMNDGVFPFAKDMEKQVSPYGCTSLCNSVANQYNTCTRRNHQALQFVNKLLQMTYTIPYVIIYILI